MPRHSYQLTARVEAGDVSDLYRGVQDGRRDVTVKVFSLRASDPDYGRALVEAARAVGALQHPSILHFEEVGMHASRLCAARAHVDGHHLGLALVRLATREVVLPGPVALQIAVEAMAALGAAHAAGVTHGALTPANVLAARDGRVFVSDFGALAAVEQSPVLRSLATRGRRAYRAPELEKGGPATPASDVFSIGAVLYELLTLRSVSDGKAGVSTRRGALVPPSRLDRRINARLDPLVLRALDPSATRRFRSCQEMEEQFRGYLTAQGGTAGRAEVGRFVAELFPNEVTVSGPGGELPFEGAFELDRLDAGASIPGLAIEVGDRDAYSAPAPLEPETHPELPEVRGVDATALDVHAPAFEPSAPQRRLGEPTDWYAPPGPAPIGVQPSVPEKTETTDKTDPRPPELGTERDHAAFADAERPAFRRPAAALDDPSASGPVSMMPGTRLRGGASSVVMPRHRRSSSRGMWSLALAMSISAGALTYAGVQRRLARRAPPAHHWEALLPPPDPAHPAPPVELPRPPLHVAAGAGCLSVHADVRAAQLTIDDGPPLALPLDTFAVGLGPHKLTVVDPRGKYPPREVEVSEEEIRCPGHVIKVALRHRDAKD